MIAILLFYVLMLNFFQAADILSKEGISAEVITC